MALKDQPYFPFYVKDFDGDEQLKECDAEAHGVYIRIMCLMHKSKTYGKILLEQKYQQTIQQNSSTCSTFAEAFANKLVRHLPFDLLEIQRGLCQLIENKVLYVDGLYLCQKRMIRDGEISDKRASAGRSSAAGNGGKRNFGAGKGDFVGTKPPTNFPTSSKANDEQNTANAYAIANKDIEEGDSNLSKGVQGDENSGGEEEGLETSQDQTHETEKIDIQNGHLRFSIEQCRWNFFNNNQFSRTKEQAVIMLSLAPNPKDAIEILEKWSYAFNRKCVSESVFDYQMTGKDSWSKYFPNWVKLVASANPNPETLYTSNHKPAGSNQFQNPQNRFKSLEPSIDDLIKNETDPVKKRELQNKKYALPERKV